MIDLHMHTIASDGKLTTEELLVACERLDLELISITDHFSVGAYEALKDPAVRALFSGKILPGSEYSAHFKGCGLEVLGYGVDVNAASAFIKEHYLPMEEKKAWELKRLIHLYLERGFTFDEEQVLENRFYGWDARHTIFTEIDRYPENVERYTNPATHGDHKCFTRSEVYNLNSPYFLSEEGCSPSLQEVCDFIQSQGGYAILAHPCSYDEAVQAMLEEMIEQTHLDGLEVYYITNTPSQQQDLLTLCKKHHLIFSAGSDFHNFGERSRIYGNLLGMQGFKTPLPEDEILSWVHRLKRI